MTKNLEETTNEEFSKDDFKILKDLQKQGLSIHDINMIAKASKQGNPYQQHDYRVGKSHVRYVVFGDTHIGNKNYDPKLMAFLAQESKKQKVDFAIHTGDILDGWYQNRPASIFEQNAIGLDQQFKKGVKELSQLDVPLYFITGNHEYNTFTRNAGIEIGPFLEDKLKDTGLETKFLGNAEGDIKLKNGTIIKNMHPDGGTAYAISYKPQKIVESLSGGEKPNVLNIGHFHKAEYIFYRNVHTFQTGTLMGQTKFMRGKQIPAHKGFWIVDLYSRTGGQVDEIIPRFYPAYD